MCGVALCRKWSARSHHSTKCHGSKRWCPTTDHRHAGQVDWQRKQNVPLGLNACLSLCDWLSTRPGFTPPLAQCQLGSDPAPATLRINVGVQISHTALGMAYGLSVRRSSTEMLHWSPWDVDIQRKHCISFCDPLTFTLLVPPSRQHLHFTNN